MHINWLNKQEFGPIIVLKNIKNEFKVVGI
jgi:hypothetical protein